MEDPPRRSEWIPRVERRFEWSRLEVQSLSTAYERALPVTRFVRGEPLSRGLKEAGHGWSDERQSRYGTGG